jgi:hypothetical protein
MPQKAKERLIKSALNFPDKYRTGLTSRMGVRGSGKTYTDFFIDNNIYGSLGQMKHKAEQIFKANSGRVDAMLKGLTQTTYEPAASKLLTFLLDKKEGTSNSAIRAKELTRLQGLMNGNNSYTPAALQEIRKSFDKHTRAEARNHYGHDRGVDIPTREAELLADVFAERDAVMLKLEKMGKEIASEGGYQDLANIAQINKDINTSHYAANAIDTVIEKGGAKHLITYGDFIVAGIGGFGGSTQGPMGGLVGLVGGVALRRAIDNPILKAKLAQAFTVLNKSQLKNIVSDLEKGFLGKRAKLSAEYVIKKFRRDMGPLLIQMEKGRRREEMEMVEGRSRSKFPSANSL